MSVRRVTAPALSLAELVDLTQEVADEVRRGCHEVHADSDDRWHVRLRRDDNVDVWLISWTTDQGTQLHDHGGSSGAYTVVEGELSEAVWTPGAQELRETSRTSGDTVVFGEHYVHDVRNVESRTAVSVHAYSPPLSQMNYYDAENGQLVKLASAWTDDPEAPAPAAVTQRHAS
ncbi:cysteine dioxygenase family protein [Aeromicrobium sp. Leaf350]|uniref:cysteine dioxygenase n=1 Tax=Aeromicrobium sp. Leaf350 TaxID=2876565 RepID=UPI001E444295|nr:cysteine dioxygenase family protein [Aeromicrobium sp. Leaf350]